MTEILSDIMLPYLSERINPERIYEFQHPSFPGCGYKAYQTLLIVLPVESQDRFCDLQAKVENLDLEGYGYLFSFQKWDTLARALAGGHLFYSLVCQPKNLLYAKGHQKLEITSSQRLRQITLKAEVDFAACKVRITAFFEGVYFYREKGNLPMAAFMLQQAMELLFRAVELSLRGSNEHCHLIRTHISLCKPMVPRMCAAFPLITEADHALLQILNDAYLNVRYREQYVISEEDLRVALKRISRMEAIVQREVEAAIRLAEIIVKERSNAIPNIHEDTNQ